jgi:co-chaperonin GroES (HSP10)
MYEQEKEGHIIIPDKARENSLMGYIVAVGETDTKQKFAVGELVAWKKYTGVDVYVDGKNIVILNFEDIIAKVEL